MLKHENKYGNSKSMAEGRLAPVPFETQEQYVSAPLLGADFSLKAPGITFPELPFFVPEQSFPRDGNDMADVDVYHAYLTDPLDTVPTQVNPELNPELIHQHIYFPKTFHRQKKVPREMKDMIVKEFGDSPYSQIIMRSYQEQKVHKRFKGRVLLPPIDVMKKALIDYRHLDILGAAAIGRRIALAPESIESFAANQDLPKQARQYSPLERASLFDNEVERMIRILKSPQVTPQRIITGAISRMARMLNHQRLNEETQRRIEQDPIYYPVRIRKPEHLYTLSNELLNRICAVHLVPQE